MDESCTLIEGGKKKHKKLRIETLLGFGFFAIILTGALLLKLPVAAEKGVHLTFLQTLFTATSATCVTGLVVVDTATSYSTFGEMVVISLIQVGGLGFMLLAALVMVVTHRRISLKNRALLRDAMNLPGLSGSIRTSLRFVLAVFILEMTGAMLLSFRFVPQFGLKRGVYYAMFHAVSAFCNAGFDLFGAVGSLQAYQHDPYVLLIISSLIILGGIGFAVLIEACRMKTARRMSLHAKVVITMTLLLLTLGTLLIFLIESNNPKTLGNMPFGSKVLNAWFQSATTRTAGFFSFSQLDMTDAGKLISSILMFIGASPVSTGGGVKTSTLAVLVATVLAVTEGRDDVNLFKRQLPLLVVRTALCIFLMFLTLALFGTLVLSIENGHKMQLIDLMFEVCSALGTVGLTSAGTDKMTALSQVVLIIFMYIGRVGPMTLMLMLLRRNEGKPSKVLYPKDELIIG